MELCPLKFSLAACALCSGKPLECAVPSLHLQSIPGCGCRRQLSQSSCPFHCPASHFPARTVIPWKRLLLPGAAAVWALAGITLTMLRVLLSVTSPGGNAQPSCPRVSGWFLSITATPVSSRNVARDSQGVSQTPLCAGQEFQSPVGSQRLQHFRHPPQGSPLAQPSASFVCLHSRERCSSWRNHISACEKPQPRCC